MTVITGKFDWSDVHDGLRSMSRAANSRRALDVLKEPAKQDMAEHAKKQEGPEGNWTPRARSTVLRRRKTRSRRLIRGPNKKLLNTLPRRTIRLKVTGKALTLYSKVPWAGIHQTGGRVGRGAVIPARPFLWFSQKFLNDAIISLRVAITQAWGWQGGR